MTTVFRFSSFLLLFTFLNHFSFSQGSGNTLFFDGVEDYVPIDMSYSATDEIPELTVMAWVMVPSIGGGDWAIIDFDRSDFYNLAVGAPGGGGGTGGYVVFNTTSNGGVIDDFSFNAGINDDQWHHIAATYALGIKKLYVDGELVATKNAYTSTANIGGNGISGDDRFGMIGDGSEATVYDGLTNEFNYKGNIEELQIWHQELSQQEIRNWMCKTVNNSHPNYANMEAYFQFDEAVGSTMINDPINSYFGEPKPVSSPPSWEVSAAPIGNDNNYELSVSTGSTLGLSFPAGDSIAISVTGGSANSAYIYRVDSAPNVTTPPSGINNLSAVNYYGVAFFGASNITYDLTYYYAGHPGIQDENALELCDRSNNAATAWAVSSASLNTTSNTLSLNSLSGNSEFILSSLNGSNSLCSGGDASFNYGATNFCMNGSNPIATITGDTGGVFSTTSASLNLDSSSGEIDLSNSTSGSHTVTYTSGGACVDTSKVVITLISVNTTITLTDPISITATQSGANYQWLDCDNSFMPISGETSQNFVASSNGSYAVEITENGCVDTSNCETINSVGINEVQDRFVIYPNPAQDYFILENSHNEQCDLTIISMRGEVLKQVSSVQAKQTIDISTYATGIYIVQLRYEDEVISFQLTKK